MSRRSLPLATVNGTATRATSLYDQLRADLLGGALEPGTKLAIEALAEHYATSATPLREALNRLVADGLVERREQRGFVVAGISEHDLAEITKTRCWLEEIALRESIKSHSTAGKRPWCWPTTGWRARRARCRRAASRTTPSGSRCTVPSTAR
jgi:DNA-binding GntR family transcriptional regulator